ncbi:MAG: hypothetical protein R3B93_23720 [Bacteroidia bacterium]
MKNISFQIQPGEKVAIIGLPAPGKIYPDSFIAEAIQIRQGSGWMKIRLSFIPEKVSEKK